MYVWKDRDLTKFIYTKIPRIIIPLFMNILFVKNEKGKV